jgi:hypothetical protein
MEDVVVEASLCALVDCIKNRVNYTTNCNYFFKSAYSSIVIQEVLERFEELLKAHDIKVERLSDADLYEYMQPLSSCTAKAISRGLALLAFKDLDSGEMFLLKCREPGLMWIVDGTPMESCGTFYLKDEAQNYVTILAGCLGSYPALTEDVTEAWEFEYRSLDGEKLRNGSVVQLYAKDANMGMGVGRLGLYFVDKEFADDWVIDIHTGSDIHLDDGFRLSNMRYPGYYLCINEKNELIVSSPSNLAKIFTNKETELPRHSARATWHFSTK